MYVNNKPAGLFHRYLTDCPKGMVVDHINHNTLDNRRSNLRICTNKENVRNNQLRALNTSGHKGVTWNKRENKWQVYIRVNYKFHTLGYFNFTDFEKACECRERADVKYFGEYSIYYDKYKDII